MSSNSSNNSFNSHNTSGSKSNTKKGKGSDEDANAKKLFSFLVFGGLVPEGEEEKEQESTLKKNILSALDRRKKMASKPLTAEEETTRKVIQGLRLDDHFPLDAEAMKQRPWYQTTYKFLQWHRDNYLVGTEYADWKKKEREKERLYLWNYPIRSVLELPKDPTAFSHGHLAPLAADFIPSVTVQAALLPLVVQQLGVPTTTQSTHPPKSTVLYHITQDALVSVLLGQQQRGGPVDTIIKSSIIQFLSNPQSRLAMKTRAEGFLLRKGPPKADAATKNPNPSTPEGATTPRTTATST